MKSALTKTTALIFLFFFCISLSLKAQTVIISGTQPVDIGCEYEYTAGVSNLPSNWTVLDYEWQATFIGPNGKMRYVSRVYSILVLHLLQDVVTMYP